MMPLRAALVIVLLFASAAQAAQSMTIVYNTKATPPRVMNDGIAVSEDKPGISIELLRMVGEKFGVDITFKRVPWNRCLEMVESGKADATFHASYKKERAAYGVYPMVGGNIDSTRRIYANSYVLYVRKGSKVTWDGKGIEGLTGPVGAQTSFAVVDDLHQLGYAIDEVNGVHPNLRKLLAGKISAYADIETLVDYEIAKHPGRYTLIEKLPMPFIEKNYYLLVAKGFYADNPELVENIYDAIRDVQQTDEYRDMVERYR